MPIREFKPIRPIDFGTTSDILGQAGKQFQQAGTAFKDVLKGAGKRYDAQAEIKGAADDLAIQANLDKFKSLAELNQAEKAGQLSTGALQKQYGTDYNPEKIKSYKDTLKATLRGQAVDTATGEALTAAKGAQDIGAGIDVLRKSLQASGMSPTEIMKQTAKFNESATALKGQFAKLKETAYTNAFDTAISAISSGQDPTAVVNSAGANLSGEQKLKLIQQSRDFAEVKSKLTPDQQIDMERFNADNQAVIDTKIRQHANILSTLQSQADAIPDPVSPVVSSEFENVTKPGVHVMDKIRGEVADPLFAGIFNAVFQVPFSGVTTGDAAADIFEEKYNEIAKRGGVSQSQAAAIVWQAWKDTTQQSQTFGAPGVNKKAFDDKVAELTGAMVLKSDARKAVMEAKQRQETELSSLLTKNRQLNTDYLKSVRKGNLTGKERKLFKTLKETKATEGDPEGNFIDTLLGAGSPNLGPVTEPPGVGTPIDSRFALSEGETDKELAELETFKTLSRELRDKDRDTPSWGLPIKTPDRRKAMLIQLLKTLNPRLNK